MTARQGYAFIAMLLGGMFVAHGFIEKPVMDNYYLDKERNPSSEKIEYIEDRHKLWDTLHDGEMDLGLAFILGGGLFYLIQNEEPENGLSNRPSGNSQMA